MPLRAVACQLSRLPSKAKDGGRVCAETPGRSTWRKGQFTLPQLLFAIQFIMMGKGGRWGQEVPVMCPQSAQEAEREGREGGGRRT